MWRAISRPVVAARGSLHARGLPSSPSLSVIRGRPFFRGPSHFNGQRVERLLVCRTLFTPTRGTSKQQSHQSELAGLRGIIDVPRKQISAAYADILQSPYARLMRLDKPIGNHLIFLPAAWGLALGASSVYDAVVMHSCFYAAAVMIRGAGCTVNDMWDKDFDARVERTKKRPIAAGEISQPAALAFLGTQLSAALAYLLTLNRTAIMVGIPNIIPIILYPLAKRYTRYPQAVLGLTFNWGALIGYAAAADTLAPPIFMLYGASWCWTMIYDTIYAHQDKRDDITVGVKSPALSLGDNTRPALTALALAKAGLLGAAGYSAGLSEPYFLGAGLASLHTLRQIWTTDLDNPKQCWRAFEESTRTGVLVWAGIALGRFF